MIKLILSLAGVVVAGAAWAASNKSTEKNSNKVAYNERNSSRKDNENNFLDFSGGLFGI